MILIISLVTSASFGNQCKNTKRSCLTSSNQTSQTIKILCPLLEELTVEGKSQASVQLDLSYGDGLGEPQPGAVNCNLFIGTTEHSINFNNPFWGTVLHFNLISEKQLIVTIRDGWSSNERSDFFSLN